MSELYKRIESMCRERGVNITEMCRASGAPRGSLTDLKAGRTNGLASNTLSKIAGYLEVSVDELLGNENTKKTAGQMADGRGMGFEKLYGQLTPENQKMIDALIDSLLKSQSGE